MKDGGRIVNISSGLARFSLPGVLGLRRDEGCHRGVVALFGKGTGAAENCGERDCPGGH